MLMLLAVLVLTSLIVLFFSLATNDRTNTNSYAQSMKSDELAVGALELVIGQLRAEIADPDRSIVSDSPLAGAPTIHVPAQPQFLLPERTVSGTSSNLIKMSQRAVPLYSEPDAPVLASQSSSATPSRNGRAMTLERWDKTGFAAFTGTSALPAPDWVYFNRKGNVTDPAIDTVREDAGDGFVIGRAAFAVYDISGLLDANVAGYPTSLTAKEAGRKGSPALARLQGIGLNDTQVDNLVAFRNALSRTTFLDYLGKGDQHKGFTKTVPGDNRFLSRQELLRFAKVNGFAGQLPLLTVFSRELNAPTHAPPAGATINPNVNPNLATLRHAVTGRILFERRFPLSRLALFQNPAANAAEITKYFGLTYDPNTRSFTYKSSTIKTAAQLAASSAFPEIDFFETLKAGILEGSIGQSAGTTATVSDDPDKDAHIMQIGANIIDQYDLDADRDANGIPIPIPTTIVFGAKTLYGVENLPYVNKVAITGQIRTSTGGLNNMKVGRDNNDGEGNFENPDTYCFFAGAELWNPHFQSVPASPAPSQSLYNPSIRMKTSGATQVTVFVSDDATPSGSPGGVGASTPPLAMAPKSVDYEMTFSSTGNQTSSPDYQFYYFVEPRLISTTEAITQFTYDKVSAQAGNPDALTFCFNSAEITLTSPLSVELAVIDANGVPRIYQKTLASALPSLKISKTPNAVARVHRTTNLAHSDPRTNRLGYFGINYSPYRHLPAAATPMANPLGSAPAVDSTSFAANSTYPFSLRPRFDKFGRPGDASGYGVATTDGVPNSAYSPSSTGLYLGLLWENTNPATQARDPDGTFRLGDGGFPFKEGFTAAQAGLNPMEPLARFRNPAIAYPNDSLVRTPGVNNARPVILDRPFRSVAELGYVFRDVPWRSLNFSSTDTGDAALLDLFCLEDSEIVAGKVNLNTSQATTLAALMSGGLKEEKISDTGADAGSGVLSETISGSLAAEIIAQSQNPANGPLLNISEMATKYATGSMFSPASLGTSSTGSIPSSAIKTQRESVIRALAGTTQTRTWNFLIDLVAQTGRFPINANTLDDFIVEGERRYWLHIAIDRYTGEIVDELIEQVSE